MMESKWKKGGTMKKTLLAGALLIGAGTLAFQGVTHVVAASEYNKATAVPTSYVSTGEFSLSGAKNTVPEGYQKANYRLGAIDLDYYKKHQPTAKDITKEEAAEKGAQALWQVFGVDLEGQVIEMGFAPATEGLPRTTWAGEVRIDGELCYSFTVDSVTGEVITVIWNRTLPENVQVGFDLALEKNPQEFVDLAREVAERLNVVEGPVKSVEYLGQGYSNNDPSIQLEVKGENGQVALMGFSRYDKALMSISYDGEYKYTLEWIKKIEEELQEKLKELEDNLPPAKEGETPALEPLILDFKL